MTETRQKNLLFAGAALAVLGLSVAAGFWYGRGTSTPARVDNQRESAVTHAPQVNVQSLLAEPNWIAPQRARPQPETPPARLLQAFTRVSTLPGAEILNTVRRHFQLEKPADPAMSANARATFRRVRTDALANVPLVEELCSAAGCLFVFNVINDEQRSKASGMIVSSWPTQMLQVLPFTRDAATYAAVIFVAPEAAVHQDPATRSRDVNERSSR